MVPGAVQITHSPFVLNYIYYPTLQNMTYKLSKLRRKFSTVLCGRPLLQNIYCLSYGWFHNRYSLRSDSKWGPLVSSYKTRHSADQAVFTHSLSHFTSSSSSTQQHSLARYQRRALDERVLLSHRGGGRDTTIADVCQSDTARVQSMPLWRQAGLYAVVLRGFHRPPIDQHQDIGYRYNNAQLCPTTHRGLRMCLCVGDSLSSTIIHQWTSKSLPILLKHRAAVRFFYPRELLNASRMQYHHWITFISVNVYSHAISASDTRKRQLAQQKSNWPRFQEKHDYFRHKALAQLMWLRIRLHARVVVFYERPPLMWSIIPSQRQLQ